MTYRTYPLLLCLALNFFHVPVFAEDCDKSKFESYAQMLEGLGNSPCLDPENNDTALGVSVRAALSGTLQDRNAALEALQEIKSHVIQAHVNTISTEENNARLLISAIGRLVTSLAEREKIPERDLARDWKLNDVNVMPIEFGGIDVFATLESDDCELVESGKCDTQYNAAEDIVRSMKLVNSAIDTYTKKYQLETTIDREIRHEKWDSYYEDLTFQYPWELLANSWWIAYLDDRVEVDGNKVGFMPMPESKISVLHPDVNPVYHEDSTDEYDIAFTVETLGFERFKFHNSTGKIKSSWGVSHMAAYLPQTDRAKSKWNNGWLFKYNEYSLGIIDDDGERALVFNINLSQRLFEVKTESRKYRDDLKFKLKTVEDSIESYQ